MGTSSSILLNADNPIYYIAWANTVTDSPTCHGKSFRKRVYQDYLSCEVLKSPKWSMLRTIEYDLIVNFVGDHHQPFPFDQVQKEIHLILSRNPTSRVVRIT